ncbi:restriction endonuclease subunit S [Streptomyces sp. AC495_CC817]|uniref:restriction endonuclease subunit S n=1 Tax=Streptomyces sp. AC495_CC817 TaxID=2823900 RepID=UPI001C26EFC7|nr:restriction endonuclease subunit S [Streptomyces sp. AC495_CC817]
MSEWVNVKLGDVLKVHHGFAFPGDGMTDELSGHPIVVSIGNFNYSGGFRFESTRVREFRGAYPKEFDLTPGDLLLVMTCQTSGGEILGIPGIVPNDGRVYLHNQRIGRVEVAADRLHKGFAYYLFLTAEVNRQLFSTASGTKILHTSPGRIGDVEFLIPPLREQAGIVDVLRALDDKIAVNERIAVTADALSRALFDSMCQSTAREDRADWTRGYLSDLCSTQYGYTASSTPDAAVGPKFLRVKDINKRNWITWSDVPHCAISDRDFEKYRLDLGDVLVARMADPGKSAIVEESTDAVFASYLVRLKMPSLAHSYFVWGFLKSDAYARYAESSRGGSVQANMNAKVIVGAPLGIPPVDVMEQYLTSIRPVRKRLTVAQRESRQLATLRDTLLPQLMSGRLRVKDAEKIVEDAT